MERSRLGQSAGRLGLEVINRSIRRDPMGHCRMEIARLLCNVLLLLLLFF
jgi:hypothetical protein